MKRWLNGRWLKLNGRWFKKMREWLSRLDPRRWRLHRQVP